MTRPITTLVIFFLMVNVFAGVLMSTGAAATLGINAEVGEDQRTDELTDQQAANVTTGSPTDGTLFGLYNVVSKDIAGIFGYIFPALSMLNRLGVPSWLTGMMGSLFSVLSVIAIASFVRGYDL